ncbi:MAG: efflux RND transporter permease subunit, partial [Phenylobacterium sp.]
MLNKVVALSVRHRFAVILIALAIAAYGAVELFRLPIDAVPDITNRQVQVTTVAPALSPEEIEQRVTYPLETALTGIPGLVETRSISRNGFSQITAVFTDQTDVYFARNQVTERLQGARDELPDGAEPALAPITTGLGEVMMWTVKMAPAKGVRPGQPGPQPDGSYLTPEGERLTTEMAKATYLRTVQDWIITPQLKTVPGVAGIDVIGGYVKKYAVRPDPARMTAYGVGLNEVVEAVEHANTVAGAGYVSRGGEAFVVRADARVRSAEDLAAAPITNRNGLVVRVSDVATVEIGQAARLGAAQQ